MQKHNIQIKNGSLNITVLEQTIPLNELLDFASRENPKRGFLFVSKVLGKHIPVKPSLMRDAYNALAEKVVGAESSFVVGMAETATGLGAGFADSLANKQKQDVYYQHTTRYKADKPIWLTLDEAHSHAVDHILYQAEQPLLSSITKSRRLILVDDEISTGRTLKLLGDKLLPKMEQVKEVVIVSLVNWLSQEHRDQFDAWGIPVTHVSLLDGNFTFIPVPGFSPSLPKNVDKDLDTRACRKDLGRFGLKMPFDGPIPKLDIDQPRAVIGDGEHLYLPFLAAEKAEQRGGDVVFQSTTRSPIMLGNAILSKQAFRVDERNVEHYIYNLQDVGRKAVHFLEDECQRKINQLAARFPLLESEIE
ncbi:phosphoribosyltransferase domain-containing protein [Vibrio sagamiensis]|uniref:Phosphoribosyltransferase n=1 Tax=Vibrio sagamiensis NBRC 104589 TaxID=1219064 RepID=A0A511QD46_9VIBR|nr:phosphoribosyltransferase domain-containing protein [Vibrio sagamiensis]GEM75116.1 hypothetical protein VSA01S_12280 [Vibrio sagamiensis NBRC 104589]